MPADQAILCQVEETDMEVSITAMVAPVLDGNHLEQVAVTLVIYIYNCIVVYRVIMSIYM